MSDVKAGLKSFAEGRRDILSIDPRKITVEEGFNGRDFSMPENQEHVDGLKSSIKERGVLEPLTVRLKDGNTVVLVGGECRLRAVLSLIEEGHKIVTVPCQSEDRNTSGEQRIIEQVTRNSGKPFTPIETARLCQRLVRYGWGQGIIAQTLGKSVSYISHLLSLEAMPEAAKEMVRQGTVSAAQALSTVKSAGEVEGVATLHQAVEQSRAAGKTKATPKRVQAAAAKRVGGKKVGHSLSAVQTEKVVTFLHWILTSEEADEEEIERRADVLMTEILK